jgi:hypothetical protein
MQHSFVVHTHSVAFTISIYHICFLLLNFHYSKSNKDFYPPSSQPCNKRADLLPWHGLAGLVEKILLGITGCLNGYFSGENRVNQTGCSLIVQKVLQSSV